jgi:aryl-alcohol dehydrogenase-like predicted oxidoreductase
MGMSPGHYGHVDQREATATLRRAVELGVGLVDTADSYGTDGHNERLVGRALRGIRDRVVLATKTGLVRDGDRLAVDARPERIREAAAASLRRLRVERIDLFYLHRVDPAVPVEESVGAMAELVERGMVAMLGLSEVGPETLRRAASVHPIAAVQSEYSLWHRDPEGGLRDRMRELGTTLVAFSPLGRGFLAGSASDEADLGEDDMRRRLPRFTGDHLRRNRPIADRVAEVARRHGATAAQVALAWLLDRAPDAVPIPGTRRRAHLEANLAALDLRLDDADRALLDDPALTPSGDRYPPSLMALVDPEARPRAAGS